MFLDRTQRRSTVGRTPLDEWSAPRRDLYLPAAAHLLRSWVRIRPGAWIFVCCECRVLSGRGLCEELITHPEESYRLCCIAVCDLETSRISAPYIYIYDISHLRVKHATAQAVSQKPHMLGAWIWSQICHSICSEQSGSARDFSLSTVVFPCQ
jgi:hypothetical protein